MRPGLSVGVLCVRGPVSLAVPWGWRCYLGPQRVRGLGVHLGAGPGTYVMGVVNDHLNEEEIISFLRQLQQFFALSVDRMFR